MGLRVDYKFSWIQEVSGNLTSKVNFYDGDGSGVSYARNNKLATKTVLGSSLKELKNNCNNLFIDYAPRLPITEQKDLL